MSEYVFKLPDLGEGTVEAEIVEWHVKPGDSVGEGDIIADVMTDKANVEVPAPVSGTVLRTSGEPGDLIAVGAELAAFTTQGKAGIADVPATEQPEPARPVESVSAPESVAAEEPVVQRAESPPAAESTSATPAELTVTPSAKVITSPAIRKRAKEAGIDLATVRGSGPRGRILRSDLVAAMSAHSDAPVVMSGVGPIQEIKVIGVRRVIAGRLQASKREIPHFAYVEELDVTALESLRKNLNDRNPLEPNLTYLPFIARALIKALETYPQVNSIFDPEAGTLKQFERVHMGIATQTPDGLKVPVVHNATSRGLWNIAAEIARVAEAARSGSATRQELMGSTITLTSLGRLGGIASTPVINAPEVAIIGVNKAVHRPMVVDGEVTVRLMMNLSSSFDHRFIDGFVAASLIQLMKEYLEEPALLFIDPAGR
jgi:2-oxoisovalerate dehydrogenase E2 component (dihydrolipoyl transacylase)